MIATRKAALVAAAIPVTPPIEWFEDPGLTEPTPITVTDEGRVYGHVATWGRQHIGYQKRTNPPRSRTGYAHFQFKPTRVLDGDSIVTIETGPLTMGTGHAGDFASSKEAVSHYDNSGTIAATVRVGEDAVGIWFAGAMMPDIDEFAIRRFMACGISGDWRPDGRGGLEMCAALAVPVPGFPVARARVASGAPLALVAAGAVAPAPGLAAFTRRVLDGWAPKVEPGRFNVSPVAFAELVAASLDRRRRDAELAAAQSALVGDLDDTAALAASLLESVDDTAAREAALLADLDDTGSTLEALNWVDDAGGLPDYIKRITKHLQEKGMDESQAIATAVNAAKKMCATGDLNFPGSQQVNPGSKAEACAAVADWEAKKAKSKAA